MPKRLELGRGKFVFGHTLTRKPPIHQRIGPNEMVPSHTPSPADPMALHATLSDTPTLPTPATVSPSIQSATGPPPHAPSLGPDLRVPPLPSFDQVNAGQGAEMARLKEIEENVKGFLAMQPPSERGLPAGAAIAYGALAGIAPERAAALAPEVQRYRRQPVEEFERQRQAAGQNISAQAELAQMQTGAEARQKSQDELSGAIQQHFQGANEVITGATDAISDLAQSDDPAEQGFAAEVMRRVLLYRELVQQGMQADPGVLGERYLRSLDQEVQGITDLFNQFQEHQQKVSLEEVQQGAADARAEAARTAALQRTMIGAQLRGAQIASATQNRMFQKYAKNYGDLASLMPVFEKAYALVKQGVGGPIAGQFPTNQVQELDGYYSILRTSLFGDAGKAFTDPERELLIGRIPYANTSKTKQLRALDAMKLEITNRLKVFQHLVPGIDNIFEGMGDGALPNLAPGETYVGDIDPALLGLPGAEAAAPEEE